MEPQTARLDRSGRLVLPASIRRDLELRDGDEVVFAPGATAGEVRLMSRRAAIEHAQAAVRAHIKGDTNLVDTLLADRRRDVQNQST